MYVLDIPFDKCCIENWCRFSIYHNSELEALVCKTLCNNKSIVQLSSIDHGKLQSNTDKLCKRRHCALLSSEQFLLTKGEFWLFLSGWWSFMFKREEENKREVVSVHSWSMYEFIDRLIEEFNFVCGQIMTEMFPVFYWTLSQSCVFRWNIFRFFSSKRVNREKSHFIKSYDTN